MQARELHRNTGCLIRLLAGAVVFWVMKELWAGDMVSLEEHVCRNSMQSSLGGSSLTEYVTHLNCL